MTTRQQPACVRAGDHPERALAVIDLPQVAAILDRIAADIAEPARARRVQDLNTAAARVLPRPDGAATVSIPAPRDSRQHQVTVCHDAQDPAPILATGLLDPLVAAVLADPGDQFVPAWIVIQ
jgi:hypothetical protein